MKKTLLLDKDPSYGINATANLQYTHTYICIYVCILYNVILYNVEMYLSALSACGLTEEEYSECIER